MNDEVNVDFYASRILDIVEQKICEKRDENSAMKYK
jgi:hypothetical protein